MYYGSVLYDTWCVTLINFLIVSLATIEERIEERRLLNYENFDQILEKLKDKINNVSFREGKIDMTSLQKQIEAYVSLSNQDLREVNAKSRNNETVDLSNPKQLFDQVEKRALQDGCIDQLTQILSNLVTVPPNASVVWNNISRVVGEACRPIQPEILENSSDEKDPANTQENDAAHYSNYEALKQLLKVVDEEELEKKEETRKRKQPDTMSVYSGITAISSLFLVNSCLVVFLGIGDYNDGENRKQLDDLGGVKVDYANIINTFVFHLR